VSFTFAPRVDSFGIKHALNEGMSGIGSMGGASSQIDDVVVQAPPGTITLDKTVDFSTVPASTLFGGSTVTGTWTTTADGHFVGTAGSGPAVDLIRYGITPGAMIDLSVKVNTTGQGGIVFDYQGSAYYKFVTLSIATNQILIGHVTDKGTVIDKSYAVSLSSGTDYTLGVNVRGGLVNVSLNGAVVVSNVYNETATTFGGYGTLALSGTTSFDSVRLRTDDASYAAMLEADAAPAQGAAPAQSPLSQQQLDATLVAAEQAWVAAGYDALTLGRTGMVTIQSADLGGLALGADFGSSILIDSNAAGWGWSTSPTGADAGRMDLLTVVTHELGHALGFDHDAGNDVMAPTLQAGVRELPAAAVQVSASAGPAQPAHAEPQLLFGTLDATPIYVSADRNIDWSDPAVDLTKLKKGDAPVTAQPAWVGDFVNHLARTDSERNPNLGIKVQVGTASKVSSTLRGG
jgi:matrixin